LIAGIPVVMAAARTRAIQLLEGGNRSLAVRRHAAERQHPRRAQPRLLGVLVGGRDVGSGGLHVCTCAATPFRWCKREEGGGGEPSPHRARLRRRQ
jgi:hypothetical protein